MMSVAGAGCLEFEGTQTRLQGGICHHSGDLADSTPGEGVAPPSPGAILLPYCVRPSSLRMLPVMIEVQL
jgi:hypothetical protein